MTEPRATSTPRPALDNPGRTSLGASRTPALTEAWNAWADRISVGSERYLEEMRGHVGRVPVITGPGRRKGERRGAE